MTNELTTKELYQLLTSQEAADMLGLSTVTLERYRRQGKRPTYVRLKSNVVRYRVKDLIEYQESHVVEAM